MIRHNSPSPHGNRRLRPSARGQHLLNVKVRAVTARRQRRQKVSSFFWISALIVVLCITAWLGVKMVPRTLIEVGLSFVGSRRDILYKIVLPASTPYIMAGLRLGVGKAIIGLIVAEFFTAISGLGGIIMNAANAFETAQMLAPIVVIMVFAVAVTAALAWLERKIAPWHEELTKQE